MSNWVIAVCAAQTDVVIREESYETEAEYNEALKIDGRDCINQEEIVATDLIWSENDERYVFDDHFVTVAYVIDAE